MDSKERRQTEKQRPMGLSGTVWRTMRQLLGAHFICRGGERWTIIESEEAGGRGASLRHKFF
jgi:hypothetical protein